VQTEIGKSRQDCVVLLFISEEEQTGSLERSADMNFG